MYAFEKENAFDRVMRYPVVHFELHIFSLNFLENTVNCWLARAWESFLSFADRKQFIGRAHFHFIVRIFVSTHEVDYIMLEILPFRDNGRFP